ncbi:hypothetical protein B2G71_13270 [Novosphingobium sp. PC22D]|uniref:DUF167 domain-containing protein n=1 Tax=Novosphingobium sp. PC22D TaxID=1962403 RepID=UPI000BF07267|nr:DUF167 domain-containing protein [Novosphingobium sp. PC22D]PEQ12108.1 hypothetical protein B2G71_13270 [Novosphingobium sp. PC22D]
MARPRIPLPDAEALAAHVDEAGVISVRVTPGARSEALEIAGDKVLAKVRAKPEGGKANEAVRGLLATGLGVAPSRLELLRGATSRDKQFRLSRA